MDQANALANLLSDKPWAGFLAICLIGITTLFVALGRAQARLSEEQRAHLETAKEVAGVAKALGENWTEQLRQQDRAQDLHDRSLAMLEGRMAPKP